MKLSVFWDHVAEGCRQSTLSETRALEQCRSWGISGLELETGVLTQRGEPFLAMLRQTGMEIAGLYSFYRFGVDEDIAPAEEQIAWAKRAGVKDLLVIPGFLPQGQEAQLLACRSEEETVRFLEQCPDTQRMKTALRALTACAVAEGMTVSLEEFDGSAAPFARLSQLRWFLAQVPGLSFTLDTGNFAYSDEDVLAAYTVLKDKIVHVHCKDRGVENHPLQKGKFCQGLAPVCVGGGYLPVGEIVGRLLAGGYNGWFAIEHFGAAAQLQTIKASASYLLQLEQV